MDSCVLVSLENGQQEQVDVNQDGSAGVKGIFLHSQRYRILMQFLCEEQNQKQKCLAMVSWFVPTGLGMPRQLSFKLWIKSWQFPESNRRRHIMPNDAGLFH